MPRATRRIHRRSTVGALLGAAILAVSPAAIAWACTPSAWSAQIAFDRSTYRGGESVVVNGRGFAPSNAVELTLQGPSGAPRAVAPGAATDSGGSFEASFALPANAAPGDYALQARTTSQPTTGVGTFKVLGSPAAVLPPVLSPEPTPAGPVPQPTRRNANAALRKAIRSCKKKHRVRKGAGASSKRKLAKRRKACVRKAKKRYQ